MNTNVMGMAATFHPFLQVMKNRASQMGPAQPAGTLVGIASVAGVRGMPGHAAYCASKAAVISYCESLRGELKSEGFKVVTLAPGYIKTPLTKKNKFPMPYLIARLRMCPENTERLTEVVCAKICDHEKSPACRAFLCLTLESVSAEVTSD